MIGQKELIDKTIKNMYPFSLVVAGKHNGKKMFCKEIANKLNYPYIEVGRGIDNIIEMINDINNKQFNRIYLIYDIETYNFRALEAVLKIVEEPPKNCYIIATCNNLTKLKNTIINRAYIIQLNHYRSFELINYIKDKNYNIFEVDYLNSFIYSPTMIEYFIKENRLEMYLKETKWFIDNIMSFSGGEALKYSENFKVVEDGSQNIEIDIFFYVLLYHLIKCNKSGDLISRLVSVIFLFLEQYNVNGIDKKSLIKDFIIQYRRESNK